MSDDGRKRAQAWSAWLISSHGQKCASGTTKAEYLQNRLWYAFEAGYLAAMDNRPTTIEEPDPK